MPPGIVEDDLRGQLPFALASWNWSTLWLGERTRPATMLLDDCIDLAHQANGLAEGGDDLLIVDDVVLGQRATLAVLEPLLADLIAADFEVPYVFRDTTKADAPTRSGMAFLRRTAIQPDRV